MTTIVYSDEGDTYHGSYDDKLVNYWKNFCKQHRQKVLYKGFRYFDGKKDQVVCCSRKLWDADELQKRKRNGFLGIKKYML